MRRPFVYLPYTFLAAVTWVAHFFQFWRFGLYEDDYIYIAPFIAGDAQAVLARLTLALTWPQGRPLQSVFPTILTAALYPVGGLAALYVAAFVITALAACIFYRLILRVTGQPLLAFFAALVFILFPADTTHTFLMHAFVLRLSLLMAVLATFYYVQDRPVLAALLAFLSLITYETPFLIYLSAPLLKNLWTLERPWSRILRHEATGAAMVILTVLVRGMTGDARLLGLGTQPLWITFRALLAGLFWGPMRVLRQLSYGPMRAIPAWTIGTIIVMAVSIPVVYGMLRYVMARNRVDDGAFHIPTLRSSSANWRDFLPLLLSAGIMLVVAYLGAFTHSAQVVAGRLTSVHLAASVAGSLLFAAVAYGALFYLSHPIWRQLLLVGLAIQLSIFIGYRFDIQEDFATAWDAKRWLWTNIIDATPDLTDGTVIIVDADSLPLTTYINTISWEEPRIMGLLYEFPEGWEQPPVVLTTAYGADLQRAGDDLVVTWPSPEATYRLEPQHTIVLRYDGARLVRCSGPTVTVDGAALPVRPPDDTPTSFGRTPLYDVVISPVYLVQPWPVDARIANPCSE